MIARIAMAVVALTWVGTAHATLITLEPDDFAIGTDLRTVLPEVILSVVDQPLEPVLAGNATASGGCGSTPAPEPCTSTGVLVFSRDEHSNPDHWQHGLAELRADFTVAVDFVAIDLVGIDDGGAELRAFAGDDSLLDTFSVFLTGAGDIVTASVTHPNIAYLIAGGVPGESNVLDHLRFNTVAAVPEPASLAIFAFSLAAVGFMAWRRQGPPDLSPITR